MLSPQGFIDGILGHRAAVLAGVLLVSALAGWSVTNIRFDSSIEIWFIDDDPALVAYRSFLDRFEADEIAVLGLFADNVFSPETLATVDELTEAAKQAPYAHRVQSLTTVSIARGGDGSVSIEPLIDRVPSSPEDARAIAAQAISNPLLKGLVSPDGTATAILVELGAETNDFEVKTELVQALESIAERARKRGFEVYQAGSPAFDEAFMRYSAEDFEKLGPFAIALVLLGILLLFRSLRAAIVPVVVVILSNLWLFGLMAALDVPVDVVSSGLPAVVLAVGVADSVHILSDFYAELAEGRSRSDAVRLSVSALLTPCFFTSATTAAGMLSLTLSDLQPVQRFGWEAAVGVTAAFALSMTLGPILLEMIPTPNEGYLRRQASGGVLLARLSNLSRNGAWAVLAVSAVLLGVAVWGFTQLEVGANAMNYFQPGDPVRANTERIDAALGGTASVEFVVHGEPGNLKEPEVLQRLDTLERWVEDFPAVTQSLSAVDSLKEMNRVLTNTGDEGFRLPGSRALAAQFYLLLEGEEDFDSLIQDDYSVARITSRVQMSEAQHLAHRVPEIEAHLRENYGDLNIEPTGFIKLMGDMEAYLLASQIQSFLGAFIVITLMLVGLLRSARLGLFSMIPNFLPVMLGLGFMGVIGIPLDPGTVMIGSIALGLVVDDTVHFLVRLRRELEADKPLPEAIRQTLLRAGRPIVLTSVVLVGGFIVLTFASFTPNINFGGVTSAVIVFALVADLVMLPAALLIIQPRLR